MNNGNPAPDVVEALRSSLGSVSMTVSASEIAETGRLRRRRVRAAGAAAGVALIAGVGFAAGQIASAPTGTTGASTDTHIHTLAFNLDSQADGSVRLTWDKQRYVTDRDALVAALRAAGMPVIMRVGEFCAGPHDDTTVDTTGVGPGVKEVMKGVSSPDGTVVFDFYPSAMPKGKELFIGYLNTAQLAVTQGRPGSVERLVSSEGPLTCTSTLSVTP